MMSMKGQAQQYPSNSEYNQAIEQPACMTTCLLGNALQAPDCISDNHSEQGHTGIIHSSVWKQDIGMQRHIQTAGPPGRSPW